MRIRRIRNENTKEILRALKNNDGYCPCKIKRTPETKCICQEFLNGDVGVCHCGLYEKLEN